MTDNNNSLLPLAPPSEPNGTSSIEKDFIEWMQAGGNLKKIEKEMKQLAANLSHMKNIAYGLVMFFDLNSELGDTKMSLTAAVSNFDSDLRTLANGAQSAINQAAQDAKELQGKDISPQKAKQLADDMQKQMGLLVKYVKEIKGALQEAKNLGLATDDSVKPLEDALNQIKSAFGVTWGDNFKMAADIENAIKQADKKGGFDATWRNLSNGMQQTIQGVSSMSTSANTQLQFIAEQYKKSIQMEQTAMQAEQTMTKSAVNNQISH